jgi:hypothetical protein
MNGALIDVDLGRDGYPHNVPTSIERVIRVGVS